MPHSSHKYWNLNTLNSNMVPVDYPLEIESFKWYERYSPHYPHQPNVSEA